MISEQFAIDQVRRLQCLRFFPGDPLAIKELVVALREGASEESTASSVLDDFLASSRECPVPADIRRAIFARQEKAWEQEQPEQPVPSKSKYCSTCKGNGMVKQEGKWDRCACAAGQDYPQTLIDLQNAYEVKKAPLGKSKSESESRRYVDRVLIR